MNKLPYFIAAGSLAALVSCEPLPPNPPPGFRPLPRTYPQGPQGDPYQDTYRDPQANPDAPFGPRGGDDQMAPPRDPVPPREQYPTAERTANPNQVLSPYAPYNVIDVEGFRSGQLAKDPSNGKIFRVP